MRCSRFCLPLIAGLLTGTLFAILAVPLNAADSHSRYDVSKEVTISATVRSVLPKPTTGMSWGSHLVVETGYGKLNASLGRFGLVGEGALSVAPGQQIELTGVMKKVRDQEVFMVRSITANGKIYTMRNEHGIEVPPQARERAAERGVTL